MPVYAMPNMTLPESHTNPVFTRSQAPECITHKSIAKYELLVQALKEKPRTMVECCRLLLANSNSQSIRYLQLLTNHGLLREEHTGQLNKSNISRAKRYYIHNDKAQVSDPGAVTDPDELDDRIALQKHALYKLIGYFIKDGENPMPPEKKAVLMVAARRVLVAIERKAVSTGPEAFYKGEDRITPRADEPANSAAEEHVS